jgi:hypothetical protein
MRSNGAAQDRIAGHASGIAPLVVGIRLSTWPCLDWPLQDLAAHGVAAREVSEGQGSGTESNREFRLMGGAALPWSVTHRTTFGDSVETVRMQLHPISQTEHERLKQEVVQVVRIGPVVPNQWSPRLILTIATIIPFGGVSLL